MLAWPKPEFKVSGGELFARAGEGENEEETNEAARLSAGGADGERLSGGPGGPDEGGSLDIEERKKRKGKGKSREEERMW